MKLKVKKLQFEASDYRVVVINSKDAEKLGQKAGERVMLKKISKKTQKRTITGAILDIAYSDTLVAPGEIGIFRDIYDKFEEFNDVSELSVKPADKPKSFKFIKKKIDGNKLNTVEINSIIEDTVSGYLSQIELSSFITGVSIQGMDNNEMTALTIAMTLNGDVFNFGSEESIKL